MNKSLRRVEKLVDATNSALAQIKSSLTFDDWSGKPGTGPERDLASRTPQGYSSRPQEFQRLDHDFKSHANKVLSDMDKLLNSKKISCSRTDESRVSRAHCKMKEINEKIVHLRSKGSRADETKQSRKKLLRLTNEDFHGPGATEGNQKESERNKQIFSFECERGLGKESFFSEPEDPLPSNRKPKEELKNKILETQEIVDRGFHTARQLTQKVENMSKPEIKCEKTSSSGSTAISELRDLRSLNWSRRSRSFEAFEVVDSRRCSRRRVNQEKQNRRPEKKNILVKMKRAKWREATVPHLKFQRLPSLHIKGELQLQTIHNLEILPENSEPAFSKTNTAFNILSHEKIEREKKKKMLEEFEKENRFPWKDESLGAAVKCSNCGKIIKMQKESIDSREIDKVLFDCNFNVFDPRIEEFVEKWNETGGGVAHGIFLAEKGEIVAEKIGQVLENKSSQKTKSSSTVLNSGWADSTDKRLKIQELIEELSQKCKERVNNLEDDHLRLESILRNLYDKVSRSKEFFHVCNLLSFSTKQKVDCKKVRNLSATSPIVICLAGDSDISALPISSVRDTLTVKHVREKPGEKAEKKGRTGKSTGRRNNGDGKYPEVNSKKKEVGNKSEVGESKKVVSENSVFLSVEVFEEHDVDVEKQGVGSKKSLSSSGSKKDAFSQIRVSRETENDYKSDFEEESSVGEKSGESEKEIRLGFNNLSTVSEANSEFEKRFNDLNKREKLENNEEISRGANEVVGEEKKVAYTLQDQRNALKIHHVFKESVESLPSSPSANPNDSNGRRNLKTKIIENSARFKNNLFSESNGGERRKSRSDVSVSGKSSSTEVVASLKEILTALKDQFVRTQLLADKLTENVKDLSDERERKSMRTGLCFTRGNATVSCDFSPRNSQKENEDLSDGDLCLSTSKTTALPLLAKAESTRQEKVDERNSFSESSFSEGFPWEEEVPSAGEVNVNNLNTSISDGCARTRTNCEKSRKCSKSENGFTRTPDRRESWRRSSTDKSDAEEKNSASIFSLESRRGEIYSEGEVESQGLTVAECFSTHSIGEMISGIMSASSIME